MSSCRFSLAAEAAARSSAKRCSAPNVSSGGAPAFSPHHASSAAQCSLAAARAYDREARLRSKEPNRRDVCDYCERVAVDAWA